MSHTFVVVVVVVGDSIHSGKRKQHRHKMFGLIVLRTVLTLTPGCPGVKEFSHHWNHRKTDFSVRTSTIFSADVHDPKGSRKKIAQKKFALIVWSLFMFMFLRRVLSLQGSWWMLEQNLGFWSAAATQSLPALAAGDRHNQLRSVLRFCLLPLLFAWVHESLVLRLFGIALLRLLQCATMIAYPLTQNYYLQIIIIKNIFLINYAFHT